MLSVEAIDAGYRSLIHVHTNPGDNYVGAGRSTRTGDFSFETDISTPVESVILKTRWGYVLADAFPVGSEGDCPEEDWASGAATARQCMPTADWDVFRQYISPTPHVANPQVWCRWDSPGKRQYWPEPDGGGCSPPQEQLDLNEVIDTATSWASDNGCFFKEQITTFTTTFSPALFQAKGAGLTPIEATGHIFLDEPSMALSEDLRKNVVRHEVEHTTQMTIFPSALYDIWNSGKIWPEALAVAAQMRDNPESSYPFTRYAPWPSRWQHGVTFESLRARQLGLFIRWLEINHSFNACNFMMDEHTEFLLLGDELGAFHNHISGFRRKFAEFVTAYNLRLLPESAALELPLDIPQAPTSTHPDILYDLSGMQEGDSFAFTLDGAGYRAGITLVQKCSAEALEIEINISADNDEMTVESLGFYTDGLEYAEDVYQYRVSLSDPEPLPAGDYVITMASLEGIAFADRVHINPAGFYDPESPWPPSAAPLDPWRNERNCQ